LISNKISDTATTTKQIVAKRTNIPATTFPTLFVDKIDISNTSPLEFDFEKKRFQLIVFFLID